MKNKLLFTLCFTLLLSSGWLIYNTPVEEDLEKFIQTFDRNYPFFQEKDIDWEARKKTLRKQITSNSNRQDLVDAICETVSLLEDGHITVWQEDSLLCYSPTPSQFLKEFRGRYRDFAMNAYQTIYQNGFDSIQHTVPKGTYFYSDNGDVGYLRIRKFSVYPDHYKNVFTEMRDQKALEQNVDKILDAFSDTKGLIIDVRSNPGGDYGRLVAGRFIAKTKISTFINKRKKGGDYNAFTPLRAERVKPQGNRYLKPIVLLVNDQTASSAEEFVLALKNEAHVTILGTNTSGSLSDAIGQKLSDGLRFEYSTQRYYNTDTVLLEDRGIMPDIYMENTKADLKKGTDPLIEKALSWLK